MAGFTKLFNSIVTSSVWSESHTTRIVWVTMLALSDARGYVEGSIPGLAHQARVSIPELEEALQRLSAPDPYSRTPDFEGRRISAVRGGWMILNYLEHRGRLQEKEGSKARSMRESRERHRNPVTSGKALPEVTLPASAYSERNSSTKDMGTEEGDIPFTGEVEL